MKCKNIAIDRVSPSEEDASPMEGSDHGSRASTTTSSVDDFGEPNPASSPPPDLRSPDSTSESETKCEAHTTGPPPRDRYEDRGHPAGSRQTPHASAAAYGVRAAARSRKLVRVSNTCDPPGVRRYAARELPRDSAPTDARARPPTETDTI